MGKLLNLSESQFHYLSSGGNQLFSKRRARKAPAQRPLCHRCSISSAWEAALVGDVLGFYPMQTEPWQVFDTDRDMMKGMF